MREYVIENGIIIDDVEAVLEGIENISGKKITSIETVSKFIRNENATKFYIDTKGVSKMQPERDTIYLWLDSGYTDRYGNPIFISLLKTYGEYIGHYVGTVNVLAYSIRGNVREIKRNLGNFQTKYLNKIAGRVHQHIQEENAYLVELCNGKEATIEANNVMGFLISGLDIEYAPEAILEECLGEEPEEVAEELPKYEMNLMEKEITVGLLWDTIQDMQGYIDELLAEIEKHNTEDKVRMKELEAKNQEYKRALVQMRNFVETEEKEQSKMDTDASEGFNGHNLLGRNGKILVLGATALDMNTMNGIAKLYGFEKKDFEYQTDYTKVVSYAGRINNGERYSAIIFGACPHKVAGLGDWTSIIEKCRQSDSMPSAFDARSHSGELKVTKESFKLALMNVCTDLRMKMVS